MALLEERRFLTADEMVGARKVLGAATLTYVASTAIAARQLLRMFLLRQSRDYPGLFWGKTQFFRELPVWQFSECSSKKVRRFPPQMD